MVLPKVEFRKIFTNRVFKICVTSFLGILVVWRGLKGLVWSFYNLIHFSFMLSFVDVADDGDASVQFKTD